MRKQILLGALGGALLGLVSQSAAIRQSLAGIAAFSPDRALLSHRQFLLAGAALWVLFGLYWEIAAKNAAPAKSSESRAARSIHVFLANAALILQILPIHGLGRSLPVSPLIMLLGLAVEASGLCLAIWARRHLGQYWSGEITVKVEHQLIRSGPYRFLRHPIYTGLLTMYFGLAMLTGEWLAVAGFVLAVFAYWRKIRLEEAVLRQAFGPDYDAYCSATSALIPGLL